MISSVLPVFRKHPQEAEIIGRLLAGYGELEFDLAYMLGIVMGGQVLGMRVMYRVKSEGNRLDVVDAIISPVIKDDEDLKGKYAVIYGATSHCKKIRNAYAHCHWSSMNGALSRTNIEDFAKKSDNDDLIVKPVTLALLEQQEEFYNFVSDGLQFLGEEIRLKKFGGPPHELKFPKILPQPPV